MNAFDENYLQESASISKTTIALADYTYPLQYPGGIKSYIPKVYNKAFESINIKENDSDENIIT